MFSEKVSSSNITKENVKIIISDLDTEKYDWNITKVSEEKYTIDFIFRDSIKRNEMTLIMLNKFSVIAWNGANLEETTA